MRQISKLTIAATLACGLAANGALAHAFLDRAIPAVGSTVQTSPGEIKLTFSEAIAPAFAGVQLTTAGGAPVAAGKPVIDPAEPAVLHVRLGEALKPGVYKVKWHVVAVDTHRTEGSYSFTIAP